MKNLTAQELRIGNYLMELTSDDIFQVKDSFYNALNINLECSRPISLTEEWLLKFGFTFDDETFIFNKDDIYLDFIDGEYFFNYFFGLSVIKHVHQIQNLHFALTGTEL